jgi:hypothetical protein
MMFAVVYLSSKLGRVSGKGRFDAIKDNYPRWLLWPTLIGVLIGNSVEAAAGRSCGKRRKETQRGGRAMAILPPVIEVEGEEATIEAGHLAAKLGLSVDRLRAEMRRGTVYGVMERGVGVDEGRLRLTFRHRARSWTVVVEADGTLNEASAPAR